MKTAFWDASALVPLCIPRQDTAGSLRQLLADYTPVVWWSSPVEVASAIERLRRRGELSPEEYAVSRQRLAELRSSWREIQPTMRLRGLADACLSRSELRAADALQLAAALIWCREAPGGRTFLCRDRRLSQAASEAGFSVLAL